MCGRYSIDDNMAEELEELVRELGTGKQAGGERQTSDITAAHAEEFRARDIRPGDPAPVLAERSGKIVLERQRWGFPEKTLIFNARSETAAERPLFRDGIRRSRVVIPAAWFYEWNSAKEKNMFCREGRALFLAGCSRRYPDGEHFVILTTEANESMRPVHNRMPLVLERGEAVDWLREETQALQLLQKTPGPLERRTDYEQLSLF
ncbi:MAG: SOS response-associated peptidase [Lachnospiraceae bacterium]|nr:SOS response-associated peptidase [Lachnospiraceae bacterium]